MKWEDDLIKDIRYGGSWDDEDFIPGKGSPPGGAPHPEVTQCNIEHLQTSFAQVHPCKGILEIGVSRLVGGNSTTDVFLSNKTPDAVYLGVDIDDKSSLDAASLNTHTLKCSSSDYDIVVDRLQELGIEEIDYLFIDGWHSINQVLADWEFTRILSPHGIVGFHDTTRHPGPYSFVRNLDPAKWVVDIECPQDNGIAFARKLNVV